MPATTVATVAHSHHKGEKRAAYLLASGQNGWGQAGTSGCGSMSLLREDAGQVMVLPATCGCWRCALCGPRRAAWLTAQITRLVEAQTLNRFWTLTLRRKIDEPTEADVAAANKHLTASFNRFRLAAKRRWPEYAYLWAREHTVKRWPHLHMACNVNIDMDTLSAMWLKATGDSWIVDPKEDETIEHGSYFAKYVCDEAISSIRPRYARAFSKSRAVKMDPFRPKSEHPQTWRLSKRAYWATVTLRIEAGDVPARQKSAGTPWCILDRPSHPEALAWDGVAQDVGAAGWQATPRPDVPPWTGAGPMVWFGLPGNLTGPPQ